MEQILKSLQHERELDGFSSVHQQQTQAKSLDGYTQATNSLIDALKAALANLQHAPSSSAEVATSATATTTTGSQQVTADWLLRQCETVPSALGSQNLALAILSASRLSDEAQQQAALFDALGEGEDAMRVLFELVPLLSEIRKNITESSLQSGGGSATASTTFVDVEEERRQMLVHQAQEAAQIAAIAKAEASAASSSFASHGATHTVTRKSDLKAQKTAKKAAKRAAAALKAAKDAGAIVDETQLLSLADEGGVFGAGGLMGKTNEELQSLQKSLLPEGTREYHEKQGLPAGTEREYEEGYEKVTIPAPFRDESDASNRRLPINEIMSGSCAQVFAGTASLNPMQSKVFETAYHHRDNLLVCAPTGAGKTNVALTTVASHFRDVGLLNDPNFSEVSLLETGSKVVYIAPMKALAQEVVSKFHSKLHPMKLIVKELTGDMQLTRAEAEAANVIVTTPEKWDVVTRKSGNDENSLGNQCGLLIIDEVHLLADERGAVIESVVARVHRLVESRQRQVRIVGLSATLPNYKDVAQFLQVPPRGLFFFGPEHRPVPLQQQFIGVISQTKDRWLREKKMDDVCYEVVVDSLRRGYQVMVFVHSRKGTGDTASALAERAQEKDDLEHLFITMGKEGDAGEAHKRYADRVKKSRSREVGLHFDNGLGIHHAGMLRGDRKLTEQMFADGAIKVLCCTATLAWGVNLPAHTVVIKGTEVYNAEKGGIIDLSILDVQQIFGRAGRPQFDTSGEATLITSHDALARYLDKLVRAVPIESNFIKQLADHLNAEVVGGTVTNIEEAASWLTYTYLHVRMLRNPLAYGISADQKNDDPMLRERSRELVTDAAKLLDENQMLRFNINSGNLGVTDLGRVAAHFYIQAESVSTFNHKLHLDSALTDSDLCHLICCATEFENVKIRQEELSEIDNLVIKACPLKVKKPVHDSSDKSLVLMQAFISRSKIKSFTLISDTNYIASNAGRVARAMFEMCLKQGKASPALKLLRIAKSVDKQVWWFQSPLRQFDGEVHTNVFNALESRKIGAESGYNSFEAAMSLLDMTSQEVGQLCHWSKGGEKIKRLVKMLPQLEIDYTVQPVTGSILRFHVTLRPTFNWQGRWHGGAQGFWLWVEGGQNRIWHHEYVIFSRRTHPESTSLDITLPAFDQDEDFYLRIVSDSWVGVEMVIPVSLRSIKLPSQKTPFTDLMNLTPLPTTALQNPKFEQLYSKFETFNPIQTQLFHVLYHTDSPVLLGAPTGSGKTIVAELALLRMKRIHPKGVCVYIAPLKSLARERLKEWRVRLGSAPLDWNVLELSGDTHHDQKALSKADVLVCTPEKWDLISRGWRGNDTSSAKSNIANGRGFVQKVRLLVIDEIHLLGEDRGAVLEAIVSRTRFISKHVQDTATATATASTSDSPDTNGHEATRIMGLSTALANPYDLADWLGIDVKGFGGKTGPGLYNFRPSVRPIPMEVHIQGYAGRHYCPRMATMNKPIYSAIKDHSPTKPVIIFVASRRQTRLTAMDVISYAAGDENPQAFLGCSDDYIESVIENVHDDALRHTLAFGIGLHHAGLSTNDRDIVERLFLKGDIRVLVATATLAWGVNLPAHFVIVKGTEFFDGKTSRYVDYPLTDVLQMIGRAGRPQFDTEGVALVMVATEKKSFYQKFLYSPFPVESCLEERICENLNAEVAIGTINSVTDAVGYLVWTFFARRVRANPSYYGAESDSDEDVEKFLSSVVEDAMERLSEEKCVELNVEDDEITDALRPTVLGKAAAHYYLDHRTPKQMQFGVRQARKLVTTFLEESKDQNGSSSSSGSPSNGMKLQYFSMPLKVEEVAFAWILYVLCSTHEFDELPVRHNEEFLNEELNEKVPWGADTSGLLSKDGRHSGPVNVDIMADPHTKGFLLIQANLVQAKLPISDYVNDTKTVLDQIPRLLAAMQYVAIDDKTTAGSFELITQFSRTKQLLQTRSMPDDPIICQLAGINKKGAGHILRNMKKASLGTEKSSNDQTLLATLRSMPRTKAYSIFQGALKNKRSEIDKTLNSLYGIPLVELEKVNVTHRVEKSTRKSVGILNLTLKAQYGSGNSKNGGGKAPSTGGLSNPSASEAPYSLTLLLGSPQQRILLSHATMGLPSRQSESKGISREVKMEFDWESANADGGEDGGHMVLRVLHEDVRGMDMEAAINLR